MTKRVSPPSSALAKQPLVDVGSGIRAAELLCQLLWLC